MSYIHPQQDPESAQDGQRHQIDPRLKVEEAKPDTKTTSSFDDIIQKKNSHFYKKVIALFVALLVGFSFWLTLNAPEDTGARTKGFVLACYGPTKITPRTCDVRLEEDRRIVHIYSNTAKTNRTIALMIEQRPYSGVKSYVAVQAPLEGPSDPMKGVSLRAISYDGKWSGVIKCLYDPGLWPEDECDVNFIFDIHGNAISVEQVTHRKNGKETRSAINPAQFQFSRLATNAIATSIKSGNDEDGTWVETWSFAMTLTDPNHMIVHWVRIVNNTDMPLDQKGSKFSSVGMGELVREGDKK